MGRLEGLRKVISGARLQERNSKQGGLMEAEGKLMALREEEAELLRRLKLVRVQIAEAEVEHRALQDWPCKQRYAVAQKQSVHLARSLEKAKREAKLMASIDNYLHKVCLNLLPLILSLNLNPEPLCLVSGL